MRASSGPITQIEARMPDGTLTAQAHRPGHGVAVGKAEAGGGFRVRIGEIGRHLGRHFGRWALPQDLYEGRVRGEEMVVVQPVFELELPVALEGVADVARHVFQPFGRLIGDQVEKHPRVA